MGGLYGGGSEGKSQSGFTCGRQLPGHAVGQPHVQAVACKNRHFEIVIGQRQPPPSNRTPVTTHCVSCHAQDPMLLLMTNSDGQQLLTAQHVPALMQQNANPNMLICSGCRQFRFVLLDDGNEIKRRCVYCNDTQHLGYETKAGTGSQERSFGTG
jgi:hypothetical protein